MGKALTGPQRALLADIVDRPRHVYASYPPAVRLVEQGYAFWEEGRYSDVLTPTDAGRAAIAELQSDAKRSEPVAPLPWDTDQKDPS